MQRILLSNDELFRAIAENTDGMPALIHDQVEWLLACTHGQSRLISFDFQMAVVENSCTEEGEGFDEKA